MISFEQFKKKPLVEGNIQKKANEGRNPEAPRADEGGEQDEGQKEYAALKDRNGRRLEALGKEILEVKNYMAAKIPGSKELEGIQERMFLMTPEERRIVLRDFDKRFPGSRREYISATRDIQKRTEAIKKLKRRIDERYLFKNAA